MSDFAPRLPARPSFQQLQKQAKELLRDYRAGHPSALARIQLTDRTRVTLADAQFALAREHGFRSWAHLKHHLGELLPPRARQYEQLAEDLISACAGDSTALQRVNNAYGSALTQDLLLAKIREFLSAISSQPVSTGGVSLTEARFFIARRDGFENWEKLIEKPASYSIDRKHNTIRPGPVLSAEDWDTVFSVMKERGITGLSANGRMTDAGLQRLASLDAATRESVTRLDLGDSLQLTDDGLAYLARLPRLQELDLSGWKGQLTDRGLAVLAHLPELRQFQMCWQQNVSDAGLANLASCHRLESVNLLGTQSGDGVILALRGKSHLSRFRTGRNVTDAGMPRLHDFPIFKTWHGGQISYSLMSADAGPSHLLLDGPFTNSGLAQLAGLDGLFGLTFFWHCPAFTAAGLAPLAHLPNLGFLGCQDQHCDNQAMQHIAQIPRLRMLMGQGAVAGDAGFQALSRSKTIEYIWGRDCPNLTGQGFAALAQMPSLRGLAVSCKQVDHAALSTLPGFPALRELVPMDVLDDGFMHIGKCPNLEALWCMYCRETCDLATEHIAPLTKLKTYYAGKTKITDRSLEILSRMHTLEHLTFWQCPAITNAGLSHLRGLPALRELTLEGLPGVTREAAAQFPSQVQVNFS